MNRSQPKEGTMQITLAARTAEAFLTARGWAMSKDREWFSPDGHISTFKVDEAVAIQITADADETALV